MKQQNKYTSVLDAAVIGGGHAGLAVSYCLRQNSVDHLLFEKGRVGETWRSQRWDSFALNTANKKNVLPGQVYSGQKPEGFGTAGDFVTTLDEYTFDYQLPVQEQSKVISVEKPDDKSYFTVTVSENGNITSYPSRQVIIASGGQNASKVPPFADRISPAILQIHTSQYRNPLLLPKGAVLVVGSAQSGCQIAEDLASAGRKVYLSTSPVGRVPRRYRGKDIVDWLLMMDFYNLPTETVTDPAVLAAKVPLVSGIGQYGHTLSLQWLSEQGVVILGKMENADGNTIYFKNNAHEHVKFGDAFSKKIKETVDDFVKKNNILTPDPENDPADLPDVNSLCASAITSVSLKNLDINTIIWTTGFTGDFSYLKVPAFDIEGNPRHKEGLTAIRGMYFIGLPWQRMRKSGIIFGIADDAEFIAGKVVNDLNGKN